MKAEQKIRDFTLRLIGILVWFEILWAAVFLVGLIFQWSGLTDQLAAAFFGSGFSALLLLAALAVLNVTANLNIISKAQLHKIGESELIEGKQGSFIKTLLIAAALIGIVVSSLWVAEWRLYEKKVADLNAKIESIATSQLVKEAIDLVKADGAIAELRQIREALSVPVHSEAGLSLIFAKDIKGTQVYYECSTWWYHVQEEKDGKIKISEANLMEFIPAKSEKVKFEKMVKGELSLFDTVKDNNIRAFKIVRADVGELILMLDTQRRSDYASRSMKD